MKKENYDYSIECVSVFDYKIVLTLTTLNRIFKRILNATSNQLGKKLKKNLDTEKILKHGSFEIPPKYLKAIQINTDKLFKIHSKEAAADGILITTGTVSKAEFIRAGEKWNIIVTYTGQYLDKR